MNQSHVTIAGRLRQVAGLTFAAGGKPGSCDHALVVQKDDQGRDVYVCIRPGCNYTIRK